MAHNHNGFATFDLLKHSRGMAPEICKRNGFHIVTPFCTLMYRIMHKKARTICGSITPMLLQPGMMQTGGLLNFIKKSG
jgi:hypothetical protein